MKQFFQTLPWKLARLEFYKKKPFAVTCTVIFSVLLAFDLAVAVFMPSANSFTGMQGFDASDFEEFMDSTEFGDASDSQSGSSDSDSGSSSYSGGMPSGDMPSDMGDFDMGDMPEDFDMDDLPEDFDMGDMGNFSGDMSGFSGYTDSDSDDSADEDSDSSSSGGGGIIGFLRGVKSHWVLLAVVFAILDGLSIARLVILSRRLKKEREEEAKIAREKMLAGQIVYTNRPAKKIKKTNPAAVWAIPMVGVLLLVVIVNALSAQSSVTVESTSATVYSGSAETTSLDTVLSGAGTLEEEDAESMELNSSVEVSTWYVSNGDTVVEGDTLAAVDKVSVMSAIASLQEQLDELDALLEEYESEEIDDTITAASDGRVMAIYAEEDTSVIDTMYDNGSLMLLSIDGYLAVDVETDEDLQAGDSVVVILSDDTELTGKVGSYVSGTAVILVSDEEASLSEEVSVETEDGEEIGSGSLYIHSELAVTGYLGTVDEIIVEVGDEVESGDTLLILTDTEYIGTYESMLAQRSELEEEMQELFTLYQDPYLYASCAGVVSGISDDDSSASAVTAETTAAASSAGAATATATVCTVTSGSTTAAASTLNSSSDTTYTATTASTSDGYDNYIGIVQSVDADSATATVSFLTGVYQISDYSDLSDYDLSADSMTAEYTISMSEGIIMFTYSSTDLTVGSAADIAAGDILVISYESGGSPGLGSTPIWIVRVVEDSSEDDSSEDSDSTESDSTTDSSASGSDTASGSSGSSSSSDSSSGSSGSSDSSSGSSGSASGSDSSSGSASGSFDSSGSDSASGSSGSASSSDAASGNSDYGVLEGSTDSTLSDSLDFGSSDSQYSTESGTAGDSVTGSTESSEYSGSGDTTFTIDGTSSSTDLGSLYSDSSSSSADSDLSSDSSTYSFDTSDVSDSVSGSSGTTDITDASASAASEESSVTDAYTVSKNTLAEITPQDTMTITITIDELDILSLEEGQTAQVTLDAFPGQSFEGEVTAIDLSGTNSGGSSKFTAEVTITREDDMLAGMNASAVITIDTTEDVLCIPEDALVETDGVCYVYTTYDEKNDELGGLVEVTTGLSDGESVEILSGLSEGDSYYYSILDVVNYSTFSASSGGSFSMDSLFSSGGMGGR